MNWKQELEAEVNAIQDVTANPAVLTIRIEAVKDFAAGTVDVYELPRQLVVKAPKPVNVRLIDGSNILSGDFTCTVDFLQFRRAFEPVAGDTEITINGVVKNLAELRPQTASNNWGVVPGDDTLTIGGDEWQIVGVVGEKWLDGEPAVVVLTLRK